MIPNPPQGASDSLQASRGFQASPRVFLENLPDCSLTTHGKEENSTSSLPPPPRQHQLGLLMGTGTEHPWPAHSTREAGERHTQGWEFKIQHFQLSWEAEIYFFYYYYYYYVSVVDGYVYSTYASIFIYM